MAIKNAKLKSKNTQFDLALLVQYIEALNHQTSYLPSPEALTNQCQHIVDCLAQPISSQDDEVWDQLNTVEQFLVCTINSLPSDTKKDIIKALVEKLYCAISDPVATVSPTASIVLFVLMDVPVDTMVELAQWMVQHDNSPVQVDPRPSLGCLLQWACDWHGTPPLGTWLLAFIKALENNQKHNELMEVCLIKIQQLFLTLERPTNLRKNVAAVIFHVLASLRTTIEALDQIANFIPRVLTSLAADNSQWSRELLQNVVNILTTMIEHFTSETNNPDDVQSFKSKYHSLIRILERHLTSRDCRYLELPPWRSCDKNSMQLEVVQFYQKVGLHNLGNTCYMNSVVQALFVTRQFSHTVMLEMNTAPYWSRLGALFARLLFSVSASINPTEMYEFTNSSCYTNNSRSTAIFLGTPVERLRVGVAPVSSSQSQHDSYEFLGYLFELLKSYEKHSEAEFDYAFPSAPLLPPKPEDLTPKTNGTVGMFININEKSDTGDSDTSSRRSPKPSSSGSSKRTSTIQSESETILLPKKRSRVDYTNMVDEPQVPIIREIIIRDEGPTLNLTLVNRLFGGIMRTRLTCSACGLRSISRDVFRDLQLSFPEKIKEEHSVQQLIDYYCLSETLCGDNRYSCPNCLKLQEAQRSCRIEIPPKHLVIVLKHFRYETKLQLQTKLMLAMHYNQKLNLSPLCTGPTPEYTLYAAVIHTGTSLDSGHYFTIACDENGWHKYNDDEVTPSYEGEINNLNHSSTPYILFYKSSELVDPPQPKLEDLRPSVRESIEAYNASMLHTVKHAKTRHSTKKV